MQRSFSPPCQGDVGLDEDVAVSSTMVAAVGQELAVVTIVTNVMSIGTPCYNLHVLHAVKVRLASSTKRRSTAAEERSHKVLQHVVSARRPWRGDLERRCRDVKKCL